MVRDVQVVEDYMLGRLTTVVAGAVGALAVGGFGRGCWKSVLEVGRRQTLWERWLRGKSLWTWEADAVGAMAAGEVAVDVGSQVD